MKKLMISAVCIVLLCSHDLYLKTDSYFLKSYQNSEVYIFNGTFDKSENTIDRDRIIESTIIGPDYHFTPNDSDWSDKDKATHLKFKTEHEGTYLAGVATKARVIELNAEEFNDYLEHDGILNVLSDRKNNGKLNNSARELYAKSAKVLLQVGEAHSEEYNTVMGYPVEFIPLSNPYESKVGDKLSFQVIKEKTPLANQLVYVGNRATTEKPSAHGHTHDDDALTTDENGMITIEVDHSGYWYLRAINMVESDKPDIEYVSNWGTLTFEIR